MRFWLCEGVKKGGLYVWKDYHILRTAGFRQDGQMKISYEFVTGEISETEVDERLGRMLPDFDRRQSITIRRKHAAMFPLTAWTGMDYEGELFASAEDTESETEHREDMT